MKGKGQDVSCRVTALSLVLTHHPPRLYRIAVVITVATRTYYVYEIKPNAWSVVALVRRTWTRRGDYGARGGADFARWPVLPPSCLVRPAAPRAYRDFRLPVRYTAARVRRAPACRGRPYAVRVVEPNRQQRAGTVFGHEFGEYRLSFAMSGTATPDVGGRAITI
jgi:hypothetical protein